LHDISDFFEWTWIFQDDFSAPSISWIYSVFHSKLQIQEMNLRNWAGIGQIMSKGREYSVSLRLWPRWSS
jgi:hypothetical protein